MKPLHKIVLVCTTFVLAAATGHVMQNPARFGLNEAENPAAPADVTNIQPVANIAEAPEITLAQLEQGAAPQLPGAPMMRPLAQDIATAPAPVETGLAVSGFATGCGAPQIGVAPAASASVLLSVEAPCHGGALVTISHEGLALPVRLSPDGSWSGVVPALAEAASYDVDLPDGTIVSATQRVSGLGGVNRIALNWQGAAGFVLHAREYGSDYGAAGDVTLAAPRNAETPLGGWMAVFAEGAGAPQVQIYTAPASMTDIRLELEAALSAETCGQDLQAELHRWVGGQAEAPVALSLSMPDCDAPEGGLEGGVVMPLPDFPLTLAAVN